MQADSTTIYFSYYLLTITLSMVHNCFQIWVTQIASMHLQYKSRLGASAIPGKNLKRFLFTSSNLVYCTQRPSKNLKRFLFIFFPVTGMQNLHHASGGIYYVVNKKTGMQGLEPQTSATQTQRSTKLSYIPRRWTEAQLGEIIIKMKNTKKRED